MFVLDHGRQLGAAVPSAKFWLAGSFQADQRPHRLVPDPQDMARPSGLFITAVAAQYWELPTCGLYAGASHFRCHTHKHWDTGTIVSI